ncbi:hypothetical protein BKA69DRAFT_839017 [Paraphysoderma sedebokerense]|nr:hypothetical protein BKA69DRAFT_839017 [Paraphysoderma sedebokerense]
MSDKLKKSLANLIPDQRPSDPYSMSDIEFKSPLFSSLYKAQLASLSTHDQPTATAPIPFKRTLSNGHHDYNGHIHPSSSPNSYNHSSEKLESPHPNTINLYSSQPPNLSTLNIDYTRNASTNKLVSITNQPKLNPSQHEKYAPTKSNFKSSYPSTSAASNLKSQTRKTKSPILGRHKKQTPKRRQSFDDSRITNFTQSFSKPTKVLYANHLTRYNKEYDRIAKIYGWHSNFDKESHSRLHFRLPTWLKTPKMQKEYQSARANDISIGHPVLVKVDSSYGEAPMSSLAGKGRNGNPGPTQLSIKTDLTQWRPHARSISSPDDMLTEIYGDSEELHKIVFSDDKNSPRHRRSASDDASERADGPNSATSPVEFFLSNQTDHLRFDKLGSQDNNTADYLDRQYDYFSRRRDASESPSADMLNDDEDHSDDRSDEPSARSLPSERFHSSFSTSASPVPGSLNKPLPAAPRVAERKVYPADTKQPAKFTYIDAGQDEEEKSFGLPPSDHPFWISPKVFDMPDSSSNIQYEVTKKMGFSMTGTGSQQVAKTKKLIGGTAVKLVEVLTTTLGMLMNSAAFLLILTSL